MRPILVLAALAVVFSGCTESRSPGFEPHLPSFAVSDAANPPSPDPLFFWLPPTVDNPTLPEGYALKIVEPVIWITCAPAEDQIDGVTCVDPASSNDRIPKTGAIAHDGAKYQHDWKTGDYSLGSFRRYRLTAVIDEAVVGWLDVQPVDNPNQVSSVPDGYYGFTNGSTVPLKFVYLTTEQCAEHPEDCDEVTVQLDQLEDDVFITVPGGQVKLKPNPAETDDELRRWTLVRLDQAPCLVGENGLPLTRFQEGGDCYQLIVTPPFPDDFELAVGTAFWGQCLPGNLNKKWYDKWKTFKVHGEEFAAKISHGIEGPIPTEPFDVDCSAVATSGVSAVVRRLARAATAMLFGTPAYAFDEDTMGGFTRMSFFTGIRELFVEVTDAVTVLGRATQLEARILAEHASSHDEHGGVADVLVRFECESGPAPCSSIGPFDAISDAHGYARVTVSFPAAGTYVFCVWTPEDGIEKEDCAQLTVTVSEWDVHFEPPLVNKEHVGFTVTNNTAHGFLVIACSVANTCGGLTQPIALPFTASDFKGGSYNVNWTIQYPGAEAGHVLQFSVVLGQDAAAPPLPNTATFAVADDPRFKVGSRLPAKFRLGR
jgi:hypothetical protein